VTPVLKVENLKTVFSTGDKSVAAVDGVSFSVREGSTLAIVGESGSGKSVTSLSIMKLIPNPPGKIVEGSVTFEGRDLVPLKEAEMRRLRGNKIAMIFQEPMTALNPVFTVGNQIIEAIMLHQSADRKEARSKAIEMLKLVGIPYPEARIDDYPHHMSGGMRQRVMIAMALSCNPRLLIADEPTTALDVTIQAQILALMQDLKERLGTSTMLITHDLGVVAEMADEVIVMYAGKVVEQTDVVSLFHRPQHPYTEGLLGSMPMMHKDQTRLSAIEGVVPNPAEMPVGCRFHPRCAYAQALCQREEPELFDLGDGHFSRCWKHVDFNFEGKGN